METLLHPASIVPSLQRGLDDFAAELCFAALQLVHAVEHGTGIEPDRQAMQVLVRKLHVVMALGEQRVQLGGVCPELARRRAVSPTAGIAVSVEAELGSEADVGRV